MRPQGCSARSWEVGSCPHCPPTTLPLLPHVIGGGGSSESVAAPQLHRGLKCPSWASRATQTRLPVGQMRKLRLQGGCDLPRGILPSQRLNLTTSNEKLAQTRRERDSVPDPPWLRPHLPLGQPQNYPRGLALQTHCETRARGSPV